MKRLLLSALISLGTLISMAQNPCGTQPYKDPWLTDFQRSMDERWNRSSLPEEGDTVLLWVALQLHILGSDDGSGYFNVADALRALCILNEDFEQAGIRFYLHNEINFIDNTLWYDHDDVRTGAEMMFANNVENAMNCYIVQDPAGNCGYNLPYAGIALKKSCLGPNDHTWAHEVGHALSLPHPFLGWEGGQTHDGSRPPVFSSPAPEFVTYDYSLFKEKYYPDTLIIDTAIVERVDASNCREAADGFCDTGPDYLAGRWTCDNSGLSATTQLDPDGQVFRSAGSFIMSYADDACSYLFSGEQIMAMRAFLQEKRPEWLSNQTPGGSIEGEVVQLVSPDDGAIVDVDHVQLTWHALEDATHYLLQGSRLKNFAFFDIDTIVQDTSTIIENLVVGRSYYWRVIPYNAYSFCLEKSAVRSFSVDQIMSTSQIIREGRFDCMVISSCQLDLYFDLSDRGQAQVYILDNYGRSIESHLIQYHEDLNHTSFEICNLSQGVYYLTMKTLHGKMTTKFVIK